MAVIANLDVLLRGDTSNLSKSLDKAQGDLTDFSGTAATIGGMIGAAFGGIGAPIGAAIGGAVGKVGGAIVGIFSNVKLAIDGTEERIGGFVEKAKSLTKSVKKLTDFEAPTLEAKVGAVPSPNMPEVAAASSATAPTLPNFRLQPLTLASEYEDAFKKIAVEGSEAWEQISTVAGSSVRQIAQQVSTLPEATGTAWEQVTALASESWARIQIGAAPVIHHIGQAFEAVAVQIVRFLRPVVNWLVTAVDAVMFTVNEVLSAIGEIVEHVWEWVKKLVDEWVDSSKSWRDGGEVAILTLRGIGIGLAYVTDSLKLLAGGAAVAMGKIVEHLGRPFLRMLKSMAEGMALLFPAELGGAFFAGVSSKLDQLAGKAEGVGKEMGKWGREAMAGFGDSATMVRKLFDDIMNKWQTRKPAVTKPAADAAPGKSPKAVLRGSEEAFTIIYGNQGDKLFAVANKQLVELQKIAREIAQKKKSGVKVAKL